jgi:pyruvate formate lyase activating enzyme
MAGDMTLAGDLAIHTKPGELYELLEGNRIRCLACGHRCPIPAGFTGVCKVRFNREGSLRVPYGYVNSLQCDPIEKKPFFHALPGTDALSFGMLGCCLHCGYCQNWVVSQALRDIRSSLDFHEVTPRQIVSAALASGASSVISTYNEPLITSEWAAAIFRAARAAGLVTGYVTNGNATPEVLEYLRPWLDLVRVDLKTMDDGQYHKLGGRLKPVLDSIRAMHAAGFWLEVVTLIVPGFNDSARELEAIAQYLVGISPDIPWHVTAFHKNYRMTGPEHTTHETLRWAAALGRDAGLRYVYAGNLPGQVGDLENTRCPTCGALLIERCGFRVRQNGITRAGGCPECRTQIPGFWRAGTARRKSNEQLIDNRCG